MAWSELSEPCDWSAFLADAEASTLEEEREREKGREDRTQPKVMQHASIEECKHTEEATYSA